MDASQPSLIDAVLAIGLLTELGKGAYRSVEVVKGCEEFLWSLFCPKQLHISQTKAIR